MCLLFGNQYAESFSTAIAAVGITINHLVSPFSMSVFQKDKIRGEGGGGGADKAHQRS